MMTLEDMAPRFGPDRPEFRLDEVFAFRLRSDRTYPSDWVGIELAPVVWGTASFAGVLVVYLGVL